MKNNPHTKGMFHTLEDALYDSIQDLAAKVRFGVSAYLWDLGCWLRDISGQVRVRTVEIPGEVLEVQTLCHFAEPEKVRLDFIRRQVVEKLTDKLPISITKRPSEECGPSFYVLTARVVLHPGAVLVRDQAYGPNKIELPKTLSEVLDES